MLTDPSKEQLRSVAPALGLLAKEEVAKRGLELERWSWTLGVVSKEGL